MDLQFKIIRKKYFKILLSITVIISLGVALLFGLKNGILSVHKSIDYFIENNNYPDIKIITNVEPNIILENFNEEDYKSIDTRLSISTILKKKDNIISVKASTYEDKNLKDFYIWEEQKNKTKIHDIMVEKSFADNNNLKLGDTVSLKFDEDYYDFIITRIISVPEAMVTTPVNGLWGNINDYGNVYVNKNVLAEETDKAKQEYLAELDQKEEELNEEVSKREEEFNSARTEINNGFSEYYKEKNRYTNTKNDLLNKRTELLKNREKLLQLKDKYLEIYNGINKLNDIVNSYINAYDGLSDDAKDFIDNLIKKYYPEVDIDQVEFLSDILYYMAEGKIDEVFDPNSEINQNIQNKIIIADLIKALLDYEYDYYNSGVYNTLIEQIKNGEDVTETDEYQELKSKLEFYGIYGEINEDNIYAYAELTKSLVNGIHEVSTRLPFDTFSDLYDALDAFRTLLPNLYDYLKDSVRPEVQEAIDRYNAGREELQEQIDIIYNSNKSLIEKTRLIENLIYNFINNTLEDYTKALLVNYTDNLEGTSLEIICRLLNDIEKALNDIDNGVNSIDTKLNSTYKMLVNSRATFNEKYNKYLEEVNKARQEIADNRELIIETKGYESVFNEINIKVLDDSVDKEALLESIKNNELQDVEIFDAYTYDYSPVKNTINYNIVGMENISTILPTIFYIIILIVLFLFISLMIKQSKTEIATFRLLGKSKNEIRAGYCLTNLIVSIFGILLGLGIGYLLMRYIVHYYQDFYLLPEVVYEIKASSILISIIATILVVELATVLAALELDRITPIEVLNKEKYQSQELSGFTKAITSFFKPLRKFSLIVYLRNKRNLILGTICTAATFALIFTSLAYVASKDKIFYEYFDDRINYDTQLFEKGPIEDEHLQEIRNLDYVKSADILKYYNVTISNNNKEMDIVINALDNKNDYIRIYDKDHNKIDYPEEGIILEEHIANELGLKKNDYVDINEVPFKIVDISFQSLGRVNYISYNDSDKLDSSFETVVLKMDKDKQSDFIKKVSNDEYYLYTVRYDNMRSYNKKEFDSYSIPAIIIIIFAMIIGFIIILNINSYYLIDQRKNLSVFRSLGFQYSEISSNWFIQSIIQWITSILIGLPTGIILSKYALKKVSSPRREYIYASGLKEILITAILLFLYILISHIVSMRKLRQFDIIEEIKERD